MVFGFPRVGEEGACINVKVKGMSLHCFEKHSSHYPFLLSSLRHSI